VPSNNRFMDGASAEKDEVSSIAVENNDRARRLIKNQHNFLRAPNLTLLDEETRRRLPLKRIVDSVNFAEKLDSSPLQIADACAFAIMRRLKNRVERRHRMPARFGHCSTCASDQMVRRIVPTAERTVTRGGDKKPLTKETRLENGLMASTFFVLNGLVGCGHMSGLVARRICPLMKSDDRNPYQICELQAHVSQQDFWSSVATVSFIAFQCACQSSNCDLCNCPVDMLAGRAAPLRFRRSSLSPR
jgi:hypothetical protein